MKYIIRPLVLFSFIFCYSSCIDNLDSATLSFYKEKGKLDSIIIKDKRDLKIISNYLSPQKEYKDKVPTVYFLRVKYENGKEEEFSCNSYIFDGTNKFYNPDTSAQQRYLQMIKSKMPKLALVPQ